jgi:type IV pilus assembly protein PilA
MFKSKYPIFKCFQKHQKGFTLIELLVVIAILGVIAAVAIPNITSFMGKGEAEAAAAELHNVQVAATAALYSSNATPKVVEAIADEPIIADPEGVTQADNEVGRWLINDTTYDYGVTEDGEVTQEP